jgi:hypothetical protein
VLVELEVGEGKCCIMVLVMLYLYGGRDSPLGVVAARRALRVEDCDTDQSL